MGSGQSKSESPQTPCSLRRRDDCPGRSEGSYRPRREAGEERWITLGMDSLGRILVVVYTWREERVRLISARPATPREARQYEKGI